MSRWDARSLQGAASANEDDGGEALAEALAEAFSGAIKDALGESSARLPMTAFDFELSTHAVQCRVVVMKNSIFLWAGPSKGIAMMPTLSVAATSRLSQAVPLVSTLFDQSGKGALRDGGGGAGGQVVSAKRGMPGTPLPAATTALFGACDASESLAQVCFGERCGTNDLDHACTNKLHSFLRRHWR